MFDIGPVSTLYDLILDPYLNLTLNIDPSMNVIYNLATMCCVALYLGYLR